MAPMGSHGGHGHITALEMAVVGKFQSIQLDRHPLQ